MTDVATAEDPSAIFADHEQRIASLEEGQSELKRGQENLMQKMSELSAEGRVRGEHQAQIAERQSREVRQTLTDFKAEITSQIRTDLIPLFETKDEIQSVKGGLKIIKWLVIALVGLAGSVVGWNTIFGWSGHLLISAAAHQ